MAKNTTQKKTILVVEDDAALSDAFTIILSKDDFSVLRAYNGKEALDILSREQPDLILLDLLMPIMDGREFLRNFKNIHNIPVIVLSNLDTKSEIQEVMDLGASRYMLKAWASPRELIMLAHETIDAAKV
jgi:DNA-binding response OmpR family regulator